jgi:endonuclease-3 related protein
LLKKQLEEAYRLLFEHFGPQNWWPGDTPFEIAVGAILTQNTNWKNVEKAITNLKQKTDFSPKTLLKLPDEKFAELIKPAGYFRVKTKRLKNFLKFLIEECDADINNLKKLSLYELRSTLLGISGIGPETADSILLYALEKPTFVIDAYTFRILSRHNLCDETATYDELQHTFMDNLPENVKFFNEFHALIVCVGRSFCKPKPNFLDIDEK